VFSLAIGFSKIALATEARSLVDVGLWVIVISGVLAWGFVVAFVPQRPYAQWLVGAAVLASAPYAIGAVASDVGNAKQACLFGVPDVAGPNSCEISVFRGLLFFVPASIGGALVTYELGFRRLMVGDPGTGGVVLVIVAALVAGAWAWMVGGDIPGFASRAWVLGATAIGAGSLYVLSGSLLVSSVYTGTAVGTHLAFGLAGRIDLEGDLSMLDMGGSLAWLHLGIGVALLIIVGRQRGMLGGLL